MQAVSPARANPVPPWLLRCLPALLVLALLQGCATRETSLPVLAEWPSSLPAPQPFRVAWRTDAANQALQPEDDYLQWVQRFYLGSNLVPGWQAVSEQVLQQLNAAERASVTGRLRTLGIRIGAEWAKHNAVRRLNTRMVAVWREALLEALRQEDLEAYLLQLERDVAALLSGELAPDAIFFERYYTDEFDS